MYDKLVILFHFLIPLKKDGRIKGEKNSKTGFLPKIIKPTWKCVTVGENIIVGIKLLNFPI